MFQLKGQIRVFGVLLCAAVMTLPIVLPSCGGSHGAEDFVFIGDTAQVRGIWLSRRLDALWLRKTNDGQWLVGEQGAANGDQVRSLLEILSALRLDVALSDEGSDSLRSGLSEDGLQVCVEYNNAKRDAYTLFLPEGKKPCVYSEALKQGWTIDVLGFDEQFIRNLSLSRDDWTPFELGVERPSDLRAVELIWRGDLPSSFSMEIGDGYATRVVSLADTVAVENYDTARVSVFLHSLTALRSYPLSGQELDSVNRWHAEGRYDCKLLMRLQSNDTLSYSIVLPPAAVQGVDTIGNRNVGYLITKGGEARRLALSEWDVTLLPLSDLLRSGN